MIVGQDGQELKTPVVQVPGLAVGRIVHYAEVDGKALTVSAALVVKVEDGGVVNLVMWDEEGDSFKVQGVPHRAGDVYEHQHWSWPVRVT